LTASSSFAIVRAMGELTLPDKLRRIANQMGEYDVRRPVIREAADMLEKQERAIRARLKLDALDDPNKTIRLDYPSALAEALGTPVPEPFVPTCGVYGDDHFLPEGKTYEPFPPQHGGFNCRGDYRLPGGDKIKAEDLGIEPSYGAGEPLAPLISTCGLCGHEGARTSTRCPECSERW
jgi:hypothetical protein